MNRVTTAGSDRIGGQRGVVATARRLREAGAAFALALVVEAQGSTYRKPGALAVVAADGTRRGVISGGCLESALDALAHDALANDAPRIASFDTRADDDLLFGSGSGCRGLMRVLALPVVPGRDAPLLDAIAEAHAAGSTLRLALRIDEAGLGRGLAWLSEREIDLGVGAARDAIAGLRHAPPDCHELGAHAVVVIDLRPPPHLLLLGAGPEAPPLLRIARALGWFASVADHREALLARLDEADRRIALRPGAALAELDGRRIDAALAMTHLASADLEALRRLAARPVGYVGLLGPPARRDELLAQLSGEERDALRGRLHAPVGLALGGEGPEAIALAISAELQRHFHTSP